MITVRQIERLFNDQQWPRLLRELLANRPECDSPNCPNLPHKFNLLPHPLAPLAGMLPIAALAIIRLDELTQSHHPLYHRLLNVILTSQQKDGGWGDLLVSALCIRALIAGGGSGVAIGGGLAYIAGLQKTEGAWPKEPIRRLPSDAYTTAFILYQLAEFPSFRNSVRFAGAVTWFSSHDKDVHEPAQRLWAHARTRCRYAATNRAAPLFSPCAA